MSSISAIRPIQPIRKLSVAAPVAAATSPKAPVTARPAAKPVKASASTPGFFQAHWRALVAGSATVLGGLGGAALSQILAIDAAPTLAGTLTTGAGFGLAVGGVTLAACYGIPAAVGFFQKHWH